jgi:hypothetical protein|tara:strand:+ start:76 stop:318 length:243 start_codon:yes stop_codon:yes gene_type:complete
MGIIDLDLRRRKSLNSVRFVTHKGNSMKINTTIKRGVVGYRMNKTTFIGDHPWTPNHSKTTRFIQSEPIVKVKRGEEPPF